MIPLRFMDGAMVMGWSRLAWALTFGTDHVPVVAAPAQPERFVRRGVRADERPGRAGGPRRLHADDRRSVVVLPVQPERPRGEGLTGPDPPRCNPRRTVRGVPWGTIFGGPHDRPRRDRCDRSRFRIGRGDCRLHGGRGASLPGRMGGQALRARRHPLVDRSAGRRGHRRAPRLARRAGPFHRADRRASRRSGTRSSRRGYDDRGRGRDGRQQPRPGRPPPDVRVARGLPRAAHPRLDRPGLRRGDARRPRPAPDARHHRLEVGHDDRTERLPRLRLGPRGRGAQGGPPPRLRPPGRVLRGDHRPGQERRGDRPYRRLPRGLPQPARHRRALLRADLRRARPGLAHRDRPRRAAGVRVGDARRLPRAGPGAQPRASRSGSPSGRWPRAAATS